MKWKRESTILSGCTARLVLTTAPNLEEALLCGRKRERKRGGGGGGVGGGTRARGGGKNRTRALEVKILEGQLGSRIAVSSTCLFLARGVCVLRYNRYALEYRVFRRAQFERGTGHPPWFRPSCSLPSGSGSERVFPALYDP
jgi:hypothetical protein